MAQNPKEAIEPDESQTTISGKPTGETVEDVLTCLEWITGEQPKVVGTSNQPPQQEDRVQISSSPHKKHAA
jgi:hypothetical protein